MSFHSKIAQFALASALALGLAGNASADDRTANTLLGAGLGAAAGAVFSNGDPLVTLGGAAAGGVIGNVMTDDRRYYRGHRHYDGPRYYRSAPRYYDGPRYVYDGPRYRHRPPGWDKHWKHARHYDGPRHYRGDRHYRGPRHHHR